jgi:hypothetical protein
MRGAYDLAQRIKTFWSSSHGGMWGRGREKNERKEKSA